MDRDRRSASLDGDGLIVRASALGMCPVALAWVAKGGEETPPPSFVQAAMDESSSLEQAAMESLADQWDLGEWGGAVPSATNGKELVLEGCTDYATENEGMIEVKTVAESTYNDLVKQMGLSPEDRNGLAAKYTWQMSAYRVMYGQNVALGLVEKNNYGLTGRNDLLTPVLYTAEAVWDRLRHVKELAEGDELQCDGTSGWCVAETLCKPEPVELDVDLDVNLITTLKARADAAAAELREAKAGLEEQVRAAGGRAITPKGTKLTWVETHVVEKKPREYDRKYLKITPRKDPDG